MATNKVSKRVHLLCAIATPMTYNQKFAEDPIECTSRQYESTIQGGKWAHCCARSGAGHSVPLCSLQYLQ
jgi:hypothetical protein